MKVSCIMTAFNDGPIMRQSISSVLNQIFEDFELIVIDDGAGAETKEILAEFADPRLVVIPQANDGLSSARNRGLRHARGDYICFLDGDDVRAPWAFSDVARVIDKSAPDMVMVGGIQSARGNRLTQFADNACMTGFHAELDAGNGTDIATRKAWASAMEPQMANKYIARKLIEKGMLRFPNDHFFEDHLFHTLSIAHADTIEFLATPNFTYFQRALRVQLTGTIGQTRFDVLGSTHVMLDLFRHHADFRNAPQRGAVMICALRTLKWCEACVPAFHRDAFRITLRALFCALDPLYFVIPDGTPDPRDEKAKLLAYVKGVLK